MLQVQMAQVRILLLRLHMLPYLHHRIPTDRLPLSKKPDLCGTGMLRKPLPLHRLPPGRCLMGSPSMAVCLCRVCLSSSSLRSSPLYPYRMGALGRCGRRKKLPALSAGSRYSCCRLA